MVLALAVCGGYLVSDLVAQKLGSRGTLHPVVAAWLPTVLFGSLGLVLYDAVHS
jgi:lipopolysaccharide export system permease protein